MLQTSSSSRHIWPRTVRPQAPTIVRKSDFGSRILIFESIFPNFQKYFSEFSGVFFRIFESIFPNFPKYFSEFSVFFRIFSPNLSEDLFFFFFRSHQYFSEFFLFFRMLSIFSNFVYFSEFFKVFFRVFSIFSEFCQKKSWDPGF